MDENNVAKSSNEEKAKKDVKISNVNKDNAELELIIAYAQMALFCLQKSATEVTPKSIKAEIKMFYEKFGNAEVKRLAKLIIRERK